MSGKKAPYLFITTLLVILTFILGVRYGQRVERTNKETARLISASPSPKTSLTPTPIEFKTFTSKECRIEFLYPGTLQITAESSFSAKLGKDKQLMIGFSCDKKNPFTAELGKKPLSTGEADFQDKTVKTEVKDEKHAQLMLFSLRHPLTAQILYFIVDKNLYSLLESTLVFQ